MRPLIAAPARRSAAVAITAGVVVVAGIGAAVWHTNRNGFDDAVLRFCDAHIGRVLRDVLLVFSLPESSVLAVLVLLVMAVRRRDWNVALLAVFGPIATVLLTELALKPLVHRLYLPYVSTIAPSSGPPLSYPSGHESGVAGWIVVALVVLAREPVTRAVRARVAAALIVFALLAAIGLVANHFHYLTDTIGAMGLAAAVVLTVALVIDAVTARRSTRPREAQLT